MRNSWAGLDELSDPSSMWPGFVRQASGVDVAVGTGEGRAVDVGEAVGGRKVAVGTGGLTAYRLKGP